MLSEWLEHESIRVRFVLTAMLSAFLVLTVTLWRVQVVRHGEYSRSHTKQSTRCVRMPASRGIIYDRDGVCLAENRPSYCIAVYAEELRQAGGRKRTREEVYRTIQRLSRVLQVKPEVTLDDIGRHLNRRLPLPFLAWRDVDQRVLARWAEHADKFPGVDIYIEPVRMYPMGRLGAHVLGQVGRTDLSPETDDETTYHYYLPDIEGKYGVEKSFNQSLAGKPGAMLITVDASGFRQNQVRGWESKSGDNVILTLDADIQQLAEQALEGERGAVVVLDPRNGDVIALASSPTYDPNDFGTGLNAREWRRLNSEASRPLFNRAVSGTYPPGSIFKPVVCAAALESKVGTSNIGFSCPGYFLLGNARFDCWRKQGHGWLVMPQAIEQSCNAYFCQLGMATGPESIIKTARTLGLGTLTGIDLSSESAGLVPDSAWKRRVMRDGWRGGDTCNISIGQGALLATPLQMAMIAATIAGRGTCYKPRLLRDTKKPGQVLRKLDFSRETWRVISEGMENVVHAEHGTGKRARVDGVQMAGKTGTAEYGPRDARKKYGWFMGFAPVDEPRYAMAIVIEEAMSGGITAAPRIKEIMAGAFGAASGAQPEVEAVPEGEIDG